MALNWLEVFAGLKNPGMRATLGLVLSDQREQLEQNSATAKNLSRWQSIGLLTEREGTLVVDDDALSQALAAHRKPAEDRAGIQRFFDGPRLHTLPAKPEDRRAVMEAVRHAVLSPGERVSEAQLGDRLRVIHDDVALIRRYLIDHGLLVRSIDGAEYSLPPGAEQ
ncbi:DUF2087 domain-containing protein [Glutamicibacter endophyticus]|uniref:DUF2087 domain-containing protein n=1 Tax=Glutamicibacter endophyticus TaxID=1522174 RepID=UPI003AF1BC3F